MRELNIITYFLMFLFIVPGIIYAVKYVKDGKNKSLIFCSIFSTVSAVISIFL